MPKISPLEEVVNEATDPHKFDLKKYVRSGAVTLPTGSVDCLTDLEAGYQIAYEINPQIDAILKESAGTITGADDDDPRLVELRAQANELRERIQATRITVNLRGIIPKLIPVIQRKALRLVKQNDWTPEEHGEWENTEILMHCVTSVVFHAVGETVSEGLDHDTVYELWSSLPIDQQNKLFDKMNVLCHGVVMSAATIDAGFPRGAVDEAGELSDQAAASDSGPEPAAAV